MKLEKQLREELKTRFSTSLKQIKAFNTVDEVLGWWYYKQLLTAKQLKQAQNNELTLKEIKKILIAGLEKEHKRTYIKEFNNINNILAQKSIYWGKCSIDWINNRTWGNCPRGEYRNGFKYQEYKSVTGCGYDKLSTLTARMFNEDINLMSYIYKFVEKHHINANNIREKLGYGIRICNGQPYFEGAVGVSCHIKILKNLGFDVQHHETRKSDTIEFSLKRK